MCIMGDVQMENKQLCLVAFSRLEQTNDTGATKCIII